MNERGLVYIEEIIRESHNLKYDWERLKKEALYDIEGERLSENEGEFIINAIVMVKEKAMCKIWRNAHRFDK